MYLLKIPFFLFYRYWIWNIELVLGSRCIQ